MKQFRLTIDLGNEAMQNLADVGHVLEQIGRVFGEGGGFQKGNVRDENGNTVGGYEIMFLGHEAPDARADDPPTSRNRHKGPIDTADLIKRAWEKWDDRPEGSTLAGCFTDDDMAEWCGKDRNVAAKIRGRLENEGWIERMKTPTGFLRTKQSPTRSAVMCFRPIHAIDS